MLDWEAGALYWNCLRSVDGDEPKALAKVKQKYLDTFCKTDLHFFLGTTQQFHFVAPNPWGIVGVFPIPHERQLGTTSITTSDLFAMDSYTDFAVDASNRIVISGDRVTANGRRAAIGRITTTGQIDTTFGVGGLLEVVSPVAAPVFVFAYVALAPDVRTRPR